MPWVSELNYSEKGESEHFEERRGWGEGGEGTSLWQDTQTWPALPLIRGIVEDTLHLKSMVLCDCSKRSRLNLLKIRQTHYVWLIMIFTLGWLLQGYEGMLSVCLFVLFVI